MMPSIGSKIFKWPFAPKSKKRNEYNSDHALNFYNSTTWRKVAKAHKENNPLCQKCLQSKRYRHVEFTDHIIPIKFGGSLFDWHNLQSLCKQCHNKKSAKEKTKPIYQYKVKNNGERVPVRDTDGLLMIN